MDRNQFVGSLFVVVGVLNLIFRRWGTDSILSYNRKFGWGTQNRKVVSASGIGMSLIAIGFGVLLLLGFIALKPR